MYSKVLVVEHEKLAPNFFLMTIENKEMALLTKPGHFYLITPHAVDVTNTDLYLKRPISVFDVDKEKGTVAFYYQVAGRGTEELSKVKKGQEIEILGPLGRGFKTDQEGQKILIVGAGVGIAPFRYLSSVLKEKNELHLAFGGRNEDALVIVKHFLDIPNINLCSDDGSCGIQDNVVCLNENLFKAHKDKPFTYVYACGPNIVLKKVGAICNELNIPYQLSLEERMACGVRACMACSVKGKNGMEKVCSGGPVFNGAQINLEEL